jgi:hypothetical protein
VSTDTHPSSEAEVPSSEVPIPPLFSVPEDPLGFAADGFVAERSIVDPYEIADAYLCGERARADALIGFPVVVDEYDPGAGGSVMTLVVEFVDFGSRDVAVDRLAGIEDPIGFCKRHGLDVDTDIEVLPAISAGSVEAFGHTDGPSTFWAVVGADGRAVLFRSAGILDVDDLTGRAAAFVGE